MFNKLTSKLNILDLYFQANKKTAISVVALLLVAGLIAPLVLPSITSAQTGPRFNIFTPYVHTQTYNRDYYLLDMRNETKNTDWNDPISADAGDTLMFSIYYHNGVNNTTANNTRLRVSIPSTTGTQVVSTGYLWADNAENATASNPLTETGTVNISSSQKLEYISGSAKWYPNQADWRYNSATPLPNGQTGDEIVGSGINVGNIEGCWEFSGYANFRVRISSSANQNQDLIIEKTAKNMNEGQNYWSESINARPNQRVAFQMIVRLTGNSNANNVYLRDALPDKTNYSYGSTRIDGASANDNIVSSSGLYLGSISANSSKTITFEATIFSDSSFSSGNTTLTNYAYVWADNISQRNDTAQVIVNRQTTPPQMNWTLRKTVYNSTNPNGTDTENTAKPDDTLRYTFAYYNSGNTTINNARIIDTLPSNVSFISVENNGSYDSANRQITWNVGLINADGGRTGSVSYSVRVDNISGSTTIVNSGNARSDNAGEIASNEVRTNVNQQPAPAPAPIVRAVTGSDDYFNTGTLAAGITALAIFVLYLIGQNFAWFTNLRLSTNSATIRLKEKLL